MTDPIPYATPAAPSGDSGQLRVLSILHYVWGALVMLISCVFIVHIVLGILVLRGGVPFAVATGPASVSIPANTNAPPPWLGYVFVFAGGCAVLLGWSFGFLTILSGRRIAQRRSRTFSIVMAAVNCISFPFGTALGVFTIIALTKDSVKVLYMS
jgi:hypothetical protein